MTDEPKRVIGRPFAKGVSGNPAGAPKGVIAKAREFIAAQTRDGAELLEILLGIARSASSEDKDRIAAAKELNDRFFGKAQQTIEITSPPEVPMIFEALSDTEVEALTKLDLAALPAGSDAGQ